jgi:hypothetical protein
MVRKLHILAHLWARVIFQPCPSCLPFHLTENQVNAISNFVDYSGSMLLFHQNAVFRGTSNQ